MPQVEGGPEGLNKTLEGAYQSCVAGGGSKEECSKKAWGAAKGAGWKEGGGSWKKHSEETEVKEVDVKLPEGMLKYAEVKDKVPDKPTTVNNYPYLVCPVIGCDYVLENKNQLAPGTEKCPKCDAILVGSLTPQIVKTLDDKDSVTIEDVEVFRVGTWNGDEYAEKDLEEMATNFVALQDKVKPPVKLGHGEKQDFLKQEGLPAAGWVTKLKRVGDTLKATFSNMPKKIAELIRNRAYARVSAEVYPEYESDGKTYRNVFRAIALLGGDIPAIESLADIQALYSKDTPYKLYTYDEKDLTKSKKSGKEHNREVKGMKKKLFGEKLVSSIVKKLQEGITEISEPAIEPAIKEEIVEKIQEVIPAVVEEAVNAAVANGGVAPEGKQELQEGAEGDKDKDAIIADLKARITELETELAAAKGESTTMSKKLSKVEKDAKDKDVKTFVAKMKAEGKMVPANEHYLTTLLENADNKKVIKFSKDGKDEELNEFDAIKKFIETTPNWVQFAEISKDGIVTGLKTEIKLPDGKTYPLKDADVDLKAKKYAKEHNVSYETALIEVSPKQQ